MIDYELKSDSDTSFEIKDVRNAIQVCYHRSEVQIIVRDNKNR